jgi:hypothetical protein
MRVPGGWVTSAARGIGSGVRDRRVREFQGGRSNGVSGSEDYTLIGQNNSTLK